MMRILAVDDAPEALDMLCFELEEAGFGPVEACGSGSGAIERLTSANGHSFDLVLVDLQMPEIDGLAVCRFARAATATGDLPIIVVTAGAQASDVESAFAAGATDFIRKPLDRVELRARVRAALALKAEVDRRKEHQDSLMRVRAHIQSTLLFEPPPQALTGLAAAVRTVGSQHIDGDFYDFFVPSEGCLDVVVADVMGKGVHAALAGAACKNQILRARTELLSRAGAAAPTLSIADIVSETARQFSPKLRQLETFVTMCMARFDSRRGKLHLVDCGHPRPLVRRAGTGQIETLSGSNMPLGIRMDERFETVVSDFAPGDLVLLYTDGVIEARSAQGELYGMDRLKELLSLSSGCTAEVMAERVWQDLAAHSHGGELSDDATVVAVRALGLSEEAVVWRLDEALPANPQSPTTMRATLAELLGPQLGCSALAGLQLAVTEAASNIITHVMAEGSGDFRWRIGQSDRAAVVEVDYPGTPFDPLAAPRPIYDGSRTHGFGLLLMERSVDELAHENVQRGIQRIRLVKVFPADPEESLDE